ncbi:MFS transporter [Embleya sp. NPDC050493]|uniref:MFS transporter n=1 Tax=Embleya sp. NPDC050493 TaxID=3363989 RepID=UPI003794C4A6
MAASKTTTASRRTIRAPGSTRGSYAKNRGPARRALGWFGGLFTGGFGKLRGAARAKGAGESGLAKLIELHLINNAGDALVTMALATTVFFSVPTGEARDRVAMYLLITLAPFALLAPVMGPILDRMRRGRRFAMAVAMLVRVGLCWLMAGSVNNGGLELYPAAFGVLVSSKVYGVSRSAVVPRLQPRSVSLVKANSRITLFGLIGTMGAAPVAGGLKYAFGTPGILYGACVVFTVGAILALTLPAKVDSAEGEDRASFTAEAPGVEHKRKVSLTKLRAGRDGDTTEALPEPRAEETVAGSAGVREPGRKPPRVKTSRRLRSVGPSVVQALWANAAMRGFSGFLIMFLGFLMRQHPVADLSATQATIAVVVAAAVGNAVGTGLGAWLKSRAPEAIIVGVLLVSASCAAWAAVMYSLVTVLAVAAVAGLAQALGKLSLDAMIQRDIPEEVRTSAFARTETALQVAWVIGGGIGIALPLNGTLGMSVAAGVLTLALVTAGRKLTTRRARRKRSPGIRLRAAR